MLRHIVADTRDLEGNIQEGNSVEESQRKLFLQEDRTVDEIVNSGDMQLFDFVYDFGGHLAHSRPHFLDRKNSLLY